MDVIPRPAWKRAIESREKANEGRLAESLVKLCPGVECQGD